MWRKARFDPPRRLGTLLGPLLARLGLEDGLTAERALALWPRVVGARVASATEPREFAGRVMLVGVASSIWLAELTMLRSEIVRNLNRALHRDFVRDIKFSLVRRPGRR